MVLEKDKHMYICRDDWAQWGPHLANWLDDRFSAEVLSRFNSSASDWLAWLDEKQSEVDGLHLDSANMFAELLKERYQGVRVFHATRLTDLDSIRRHGLRAWTATDLRGKAHAKFEGALEEKKLKQAIEENLPEHRGGRVYSFASLNHALGTRDGGATGKLPSFTQLGGEFLASVGERAGLEGDREQPGRGYLFACNLPWEHLGRDDFEWLAKDVLLNVITCRFFDTNGYNMLGDRDCISTIHDIQPKYIELFADVEDLRGRNDLKPIEIRWQSFTQ